MTHDQAKAAERLEQFAQAIIDGVEKTEKGPLGGPFYTVREDCTVGLMEAYELAANYLAQIQRAREAVTVDRLVAAGMKKRDYTLRLIVGAADVELEIRTFDEGEWSWEVEGDSVPVAMVPKTMLDFDRLIERIEREADEEEQRGVT